MTFFINKTIRSNLFMSFLLRDTLRQLNQLVVDLHHTKNLNALEKNSNRKDRKTSSCMSTKRFLNDI